jgi:hypothetical protein
MRNQQQKKLQKTFEHFHIEQYIAKWSVGYQWNKGKEEKKTTRINENTIYQKLWDTEKAVSAKRKVTQRISKTKMLVLWKNK